MTPGARDEICPGCGLVYAKWVSRIMGTDQARADEVEGETDSGWAGHLYDALTFTDAAAKRADFWLRAVVYAVLIPWGWYFMMLKPADPVIMHSVLHHPDLAFHEAGHVVFRLFGRFITILGGTLGQLLMPVILCVAFARGLWGAGRDNFSASVMLWWLGQSFMDCGPYIADARSLSLPLVGGGTGADRPGVHDWENILTDLDMLNYDQQIAAFAHGVGVLVMLLAFAWGGIILKKLYLNARDR